MDATPDLPPSASTPEQRAALAAIAADVAELVGAQIREARATGVSVAATKSSEVDVVTEADRAAERAAVQRLRSARPDDGFFGEEGTEVEGSSGITWVIDPIDGTVNYLYDLPTYAVSIAAAVRDERAFAEGYRPIAGAVANPVTGEVFSAWEGGGARCNGRELQVNPLEELNLALVGTGFGYEESRRREQLVPFARVLPKVRDIRRIGSAAYDLCLIAAGKLDVYWEKGLHPWDYMAGVLMVREAGGVILGADDQTLPGEHLMFAGPETLTKKLRQLVMTPNEASPGS